ncbi:MAG TPA: helix-turn-helix domain-containing protein [Cyclobacteriaceae bacterium]|jgi:DNA-binding HxlR family transcriptional regulator|nr:helix-turn-helix domain-containing protein [Cyclobacteriaceae bacterium]
MMTELLQNELSESTPAKAQNPNSCGTDHHERLLAIADAMDVVNGKWKIQLIGILLFKGKMRFGELLRTVNGIGTKMLSKELQNLEANQIITRTVLKTKPITVEYEITPYGKSLEKIIVNFTEWGMNHRKKILKNADVETFEFAEN